jgi:copper chaperone
VPGISCDHCERTVRSTLESIGGVLAARVDVAGRSVTVDYDAGAVTIDQLSEALAEEDYPVASSTTA